MGLLIFLLVALPTLIVVFFIWVNRQGCLLLYYICLLPCYTTVLALAYKISGSSLLVRMLQVLKEFTFVLTLSSLLFYYLERRIQSLKFKRIDLIAIAYLLWCTIYMFMPIGTSGILTKFANFRGLVTFVFIYFLGRCIDLSQVQSKITLNLLIGIGVAAGLISICERLSDLSLHQFSGYADYMITFYNTFPTGNYGLSWTFETEEGLRRFSAFYANPLELASSTILTGSACYAMIRYRKESLRPYTAYYGCFCMIIASLFCSLSRSSTVSFLLMFSFISGVLLKEKKLLAFMIVIMSIGTAAVLNSSNQDLTSLVRNTISFQNASSFGHLQLWLEGFEAMQSHPMGLGLGASGKIAALSDNAIGGENQYIILGVQLGFVGLLLYVLLLLYSIGDSLRAFYSTVGFTRWIGFTASATKFGMILPLFTSNLETYLFISYVSWWLVGCAVRSNAK